MTPIDLSRVVCGVEIPGIRSLAAVCLMTDGTWTTDPSLHPADRAIAQRWINVNGAHFAHYAHDLMKKGKR